MPYYLSCALCGVALQSGTQCDHAKYSYKQWETTETSTVVLKKSIFGDKKAEDVKTTQHQEHWCYCPCSGGFTMKYGDTHECTSHGVKNILRVTGYNSPPLHPSDLYHRRDCSNCRGDGTYEIPSYKPCPNCLGTGGLKCTICCGSGKKPGFSTGYNTCKCRGGYSEPCLMCHGQLAIKSGTTKLPCIKCVVSNIVPNVRPIGDVIKVSDTSSSITLPPSPSKQVVSSLNIETH